MSTFTPDVTPVRRGSRLGSGLLFALISAVTFGLSGPLASGMMEAGWSAAGAVTARLLLAAAVLIVPAVISLRGRWWLLRKNALLIVGYGLAGMAITQFAFFKAVQSLPVGMALLIEYAAPVVVVLWMWWRHSQRPSWLTGVGAVVAGVGLLLVLDVLSGGAMPLIGVMWALCAMLGVAVYFVVSAEEGNGLPPLVLAAGGLIVGGVALLLAAGLGLVSMRMAADPVTFAPGTAPWWLPVVTLGVVTAAAAYVSGIAAGRRLGSRLSSFVALGEVLAALAFAWLLLSQMPRAIQLVGGVLVLGGVVIVKLGERRVEDETLPV